MSDIQNDIQIETHLDSKGLPPDHAIHRIVSSALKGSQNLGVSQSSGAPFWPATYFDLHRVSYFNELSEARQLEVLHRCCDSLLEEAYYIEKCGMYYAGKMLLLSEATEERILYSLFAAEEATHFRWVSSAVSDTQVRNFRQNPFLSLLNDYIQFRDKNTLVYIIQIFLEGWGLHHYHSMRQACLNDSFRNLLGAILKDESRHHGSGIVLFNEASIDTSGLRKIADVLKQFMQMVQVGPQTVVGCLEKTTGPFSKVQRVKVFEELRSEEGVLKKIQILKGLMAVAQHSQVILDELEKSKCLQPWSAAACASLQTSAGV